MQPRNVVGPMARVDRGDAGSVYGGFGRRRAGRAATVGMVASVGVLCGGASAQSVPLEMNLYAEVGGSEVAPGQQAGMIPGETIRYTLVAEMGDGPGFPFFSSISVDLVPFDCGGSAFVASFEYGDWADASTPPTIEGGAIRGVSASQFGGDASNPLVVCTFEVVNEFWINVYTAEGTGPGGQAFGVGFFDTYGASVFDAPRLIAVGGPGPGGPCTAADLAAPFEVLDLADVQRFVQEFMAAGCRADLRAPWGVVDLGDVQAFVESFVGGCL